jgi:putative membrane protein
VGDASAGELLAGWQLTPDAYAAAVQEALAAVAYTVAAARRSPRGRAWPRGRTASFLAGIVVVAVALHSGLARHDDVFWVHLVQHLLLMTVAAPLLAAGAPFTLVLRTLRPAGRRRLMRVLKDPAMRPLGDARAGVLVPLDYYGTMAVYLLTPLYALSADHATIHVLAHLYFLSCGMVFWMSILAVDPVRWRPGSGIARRLVLLGVPTAAALGALLVAVPGVVRGVSSSGAADGGVALVVGTLASTLFGLLVLRVARGPARSLANKTHPPG